MQNFKLYRYKWTSMGRGGSIVLALCQNFQGTKTKALVIKWIINFIG